MTIPHNANIVNGSGPCDVPPPHHQEITQEGMEPLFVKFFTANSQPGSISMAQNGDTNNNPSQNNNSAYVPAS